jgi:hypothetical protein
MKGEKGGVGLKGGVEGRCGRKRKDEEWIAFNSLHNI